MVKSVHVIRFNFLSLYLVFCLLYRIEPIFTGVVLSGYHVLSGLSTESEVAQLATTCHAAIPSLTNITVNVLRGASTAVPSACDGKQLN